ncbi:uncharacterized protein LOC135808136 [Sycon ciliatum]|uniref:uncharacterized protein LOC135808136 n=1 Tax=Sycon ciliatum TaxID=27933 RepID=UPI0031F6ACEE
MSNRRSPALVALTLLLAFKVMPCLGVVPVLPPTFKPLPFCEFRTEQNEGVLSLLHYHTMTNCTWTVAASPHHIIRLNLRYALRLTNMDSITLYDGPLISSKKLYTFHQLSPDTDSFQHEIIATTGPYLTLQLAAMGPRNSGTGRGFVGMYTAVPRCLAGEELTTPGSITSPLRLTPDFRLIYIKNAECTWRIRAPEGMRVRVNVETIDLEESPQCQNDYLVFTNYRPSPGLPPSFYSFTESLPEASLADVPTMSRFCGNSLVNASITSSGNTLGIVFHSDYLVEKSGFTLTYDFVPGCGVGMFECHNNGQCLSPHKHCDGKVDCSDGSDEESCVCDTGIQFTCTSNISECVPRSMVCLNTTALCSDGSDAVSCVCIGRDLPLFNLNQTVVAIAPPSWIKTCLSDIPLGKGEQIFTLEIMKNSLVNMYSYKDLVVDSSKAANPDSQLSRRFSFDQYNISVDMDARLTAMELKPYKDMFSFHSDLMLLFNELKDAHTTYSAPFTPLRIYLPVWFNTKLLLDSGKQIVVVSEVDGRLAHLHNTIYGAPTPGLFSLEGKEIMMIDERPAMQVLREWAQSWPDFKSSSVRLNSFMATRSLDMSRHPLPASDTITLTMSDGTSVVIHYLVTYPMTDPAARDPLYRVPNLRQQFDHRIDYTGYYPVYEHILTGEGEPSGQTERRRRRSVSDIVQDVMHRLRDRATARHSRAIPSGGQTPKNDDPYMGTARADHEGTHNDLFSSTSGNIHVFQVDDTVVFKMESFSDPEALQKLYDAADHAKRHRLSKLVFDLTGNPGGYVKQQYEIIRFLVPSWYTLNYLCDPFDFKSATFWDLLSQALNTLPNSVPAEVSYSEGLFLAQRIANLSSYAGYIYQTPLVNLEELFGSPYLLASASGESRSRFLKSVLDSLLSPDSTFHKAHPDILLSDVKNTKPFGESFVPKRAYYDQPVRQTRAGITSEYTQKFYLTECERVTQGSNPPTSPFHNISIITDGRCASACSQFVTKLQLGKQASVITIGGFANEPIDSSSAAGGKVQNWADFWAQYSIDYQIASLTSKQHTIGETYFFNFSFPLPLTSRAIPTFNFFEYYSAKLGKYALPREWYLIPPDVHLPSWPGDMHRYPSSRQSNPDVEWLGDLYHRSTADSLARLYRRTLATINGNYPASNVLTPPPENRPCSFVGPCQNSSANVSVRTVVEFIQVNRISVELNVYNSHTCDDMRLVLHVTALCNATDHGPSEDGGPMFARHTLVVPTLYFVTPWSDEWTDVLNKVCPCVHWTTLATQTLSEATCPRSRCEVSFIRYEPLQGYWLVQGLRNLYLSNVVPMSSSRTVPKLQPEFFYTINADPRNCPAVVLFKAYFPSLFVDFTTLPAPVPSNHVAEISSYLATQYEKAASLHCIFVFNQPAGIFDDGSGAALYRSDIECVWVIAVQEGFNVKLSITYALQGNASTAHINLYSGYTGSAPLVRQLSGSGLAFTELTIPSSSVLVKFTTSPQSTGSTGFSLQYSAVKHCGGSLTGYNGTIASPTVNDTGLYSNNVACTWTITVPNGYRVQVQFSIFDLDVSLSDCVHDVVHLTDMAYPDNNREHCGPFLPPVWSSVGSTAQIRFTSDYTNQHRGFVATWTALPNPGNSYRVSPQRCEVLTDQSGTVSMKWSNEFPLQVYDCNHTIRAPVGSRVRIYFTSFLLNCHASTPPLGCSDISRINLTILNGNEPNPSTVLTGDIQPLPFISTESTVVVRFRAVRDTFQLYKYQGTHYSFQYTVCEACSPGQTDLAPCSGIFPTLCSSGFSNPATTASPNVDPTQKSHSSLSHGAIAGITGGVIGVVFFASLIAVLMPRRRLRGRSDSNLSASLSSSKHHMFRTSSIPRAREPLLSNIAEAGGDAASEKT